MMDVVSELCVAKDFGNFDMSVLASTLTNTDMLITKIKEQTLENADLKSKLQSLNESAMQIRNVYTMEKEKNLKIESENTLMQERLKGFEEELKLLENKLLNENSIHSQVVADLQSRLNDESQYTNLCKMFIAQGNILVENNLGNKMLSRQYNTVRDYLNQRGEHVEEAKRSPKKKIKKVCVATMTDHQEVRKTFVDKSTMYCLSTATRGTSTNFTAKTANVGTIFPEPLSVEQIFEKTIVDIPDLIPEIEEFKWPSTHVSTQTPTTTPRSTKNIATMTAIKNVRQKINYTRKIKRNFLKNSEMLFGVKKEEHSPLGSTTNLTAAEASSEVLSRPTINPQLFELWKILGQTIFTFVGSGRVFENSANPNVDIINDNLNQIRTALAVPNVLTPTNHLTADTVRKGSPFLNIKNSDSIQGDSLDGYSNFTTLTTQDQDDANLQSYEVDITPNEGLPIDENNPSGPYIGSYSYDLNDFCKSPSSIEDCSSNSSGNIEYSKSSIYQDEPIQHNPYNLIKINSAVQINSVPELMNTLSDNEDDSSFIGNANHQHQQSIQTPETAGETSQEICDLAIISDSSECIIQEQSHRQPENRTDFDIFKVPTRTVPRVTRKLHKPAISKDKIKMKRTKHKAGNMKKMSATLQSKIQVKVDNLHEITAQTQREEQLFSGEENQFSGEEISEIESDEFNLQMVLSYFTAPELIEPITEFIPFNLSTQPVPDSIDDTGISTNVEASTDKQILLTEPQNVCQTEMMTSVDQSSILLDDPLRLMQESNQPSIASITESSQNYVDYSPASPPSENVDMQWEPIAIPMYSKIKSNSLLNNIIANYDKQIVAEHLKHTAVQEFIESKLIGKIRRLCEIYLISEWTSINLKICYTKLLKITKRPKILAQSLLELIEDTNEQLDMSFIPPCPALPQTHQKLLVLVKKLCGFVPRFDQYCLQLIEKTIFTLKANDLSREALVNCAHFYIGLSDIVDCSTSRIRLYMYKLLYYMNYKAIPLIYAVLMAHPTVLPRLDKMTIPAANESNSNETDALVLSLQTALSDSQLYKDKLVDKSKLFTCNFSSYRKRDLSFLIYSYYGYTNEEFTYEKTVRVLIDRIKMGQLKNVAYALILIAKRCGNDWAMKNIIDIYLLPLLNEYTTDISSSTVHDHQISMILFTISAIVKTQQIATEITQFHQICLSILNSSKRQTVQEAAVAALLRTNRFGYANVYQRLANWSPSFKLTQKLYCMLNTFIHRKNVAFWKRIDGSCD